MCARPEARRAPQHHPAFISPCGAGQRPPGVIDPLGIQRQPGSHRDGARRSESRSVSSSRCPRPGHLRLSTTLASLGVCLSFLGARVPPLAGPRSVLLETRGGCRAGLSWSCPRPCGGSSALDIRVLVSGRRTGWTPPQPLLGSELLCSNRALGPDVRLPVWGSREAEAGGSL